MISFSRIPLLTNEYVGLNLTWRCEVRIPVSQQLLDVDVVIEWRGSSGLLASSNDGRVTLGDLVIDSPGREYRRSIQFSPLSAGDMGTYSCLATAMPTMTNSGVSNGSGMASNNLNIVGKNLQIIGIIATYQYFYLVHLVPTLDVSIDRTGVPSRILDLSPFNGFTLNCIATSSVVGTPTPIRKRITWTRSVDGGPPQQLTDGTNVDNVVAVMEVDLLEATSMSMLMVNTTVSGSHSYTCTAQLVVDPAPDSITEQDQTTVSIVGELKVCYNHHHL